MTSLLKLGCGWENDVGPNRDSKMGTEIQVRGTLGSSSGGDDGIGPRDEVGLGGGGEGMTGGGK